MFTVHATARNITGLLVDDVAELVGFAEVVIIGSEPVYGITADNLIAKGREIKTLRFHASPEMLRNIAGKLNEYADEVEAEFAKPDEGEVTEACDNAEGRLIEPFDSSIPVEVDR